MINTLLRYLTPFIASVIDVIYGVSLYINYVEPEMISQKFFNLLSLTGGSSILLIGYLISTSKHMCKYYKLSCWIIFFMHVLSIVYTYTPITFIEYIYVFTILSMVSLVVSTVSILGCKTSRAIRQAYKRVRR